MTLSYCKSAANPEFAGNPLIYRFFSGRKHQLRRKSVTEGKKITHRANAFPLSVCNLQQKAHLAQAGSAFSNIPIHAVLGVQPLACE
jgi:hypothetical protein